MDFVKTFLVIPLTEEAFLKGLSSYLVLTDPLFGILAA
jgi:hypothetical protein